MLILALQPVASPKLNLDTLNRKLTHKLNKIIV